MYWNRLRAYLKAQYGTTVYKLALSSGCSRPNRDGTLGTRGASFAMVPEHSPSTAPFRISWPLPRPGLRSKPVPTPGTSRIFSPSPIPMHRFPGCGNSIPPPWHRRMWWFYPWPPSRLPAGGNGQSAGGAQPYQAGMGGTWPADDSSGKCRLDSPGI